MKRVILSVGIVALLCLIPVLASAQPANFGTSLHATRQGKATFYSAANGGFEALSNVPIATLGCQKCHPDTLPNGTAVDPATYTPSCNDCHIVPGDEPTIGVCLKCHGRMQTEMMAFNLKDVHRDTLGFKCSDCHSTGDIHGDGTAYNSMFEPGAMDVDCINCHTQLPSNPEHNQHSGDIHCATCHMQTVVACYNCHFNSMTQAHIKRAYTKIRNFMLIGTRAKDNKIFPASFQSLYYHTPDGKDTTFYTIAPYFSHSITRHGRTCSDCHDNANVQAYNTNGELWIAQWDNSQGALNVSSGVLPIPPDWQTSLKLDFLDYTGVIDTSYTNPSAWTFIKSGADVTQNMGYILPLTAEQMNKLSTPQSIDNGNPTLPTAYELKQNYPNPFNPGTTIEFVLPKKAPVTLKIYNLLGGEVARLINGKELSAGAHKVYFDGHRLASGVYFYQLQTPDYSRTMKMFLMK